MTKGSVAEKLAVLLLHLGLSGCIDLELANPAGQSSKADKDGAVPADRDGAVFAPRRDGELLVGSNDIVQDASHDALHAEGRVGDQSPDGVSRDDLDASVAASEDPPSISLEGGPRAAVCPADTICRRYLPRSSGNCVQPGRCASPSTCVVMDAPEDLYCGEGRSCDGQGLCLPETGQLGSPARAECIIEGAFDNTSQTCVNPGTNHELSRASGMTGTHKFLDLEVPSAAFEVGMFGFDANDIAIEECALIESEMARYVTPVGACDAAVRWVLYGNE